MKHANAKTTWTTIRLSRDKTTGCEVMETVFIIETDLILNVNDPKYKKDAVESLLIAAQEHFAENASRIDRVDIVQIGAK